MTVKQDDVLLMQHMVNEGEFVMPDGDKESWSRKLSVSRLWAGSNSSLDIFVKPSKIAWSVWQRVAITLASELGVNTNELYQRIMIHGMLGLVLTSQDSKFKQLKEEVHQELKIARYTSVERRAKNAKDALSRDEFLSWCKRNGFDPDNLETSYQRPTTKREIMAWAYEHYLNKTQMVTGHAIENAASNGVIDKDKQSALLKTLMSTWGVSGGQRGIWDFRGLSDEVIEEMKLVKMSD